VQAAIVDGDLAPRRLDNYRKLMREQQLNAATLAEKRASGRELTKLHRAIQNSSRQHKKGE
jgi:ribosome biogenesis GTPase